MQLFISNFSDLQVISFRNREYIEQADTNQPVVINYLMVINYQLLGTANSLVLSFFFHKSQLQACWASKQAGSGAC